MRADPEGEELDAFQLHALRWESQDRIRRHARRIAKRVDMDPAIVSELEEAIEHPGDEARLYEALAALLSQSREG